MTQAVADAEERQLGGGGGDGGGLGGGGGEPRNPPRPLAPSAVRQALFLAEQSRALKVNFRLVQGAVFLFLASLAVQYLYFGLLSATEDEPPLRSLNALSQFLGMTAMGIAAAEMALSYRPLAAEASFEDRWERALTRAQGTKRHGDSGLPRLLSTRVETARASPQRAPTRGPSNPVLEAFGIPG